MPAVTASAVLPGDLKLKRQNYVARASEGMLCSYSELGISDDHSGIIELPLDATIGTDIREYLNLMIMQLKSALHLTVQIA